MVAIAGNTQRCRTLCILPASSLPWVKRRKADLVRWELEHYFS
ncbi:hypothetical protein HMPREF0299_5013 [Corynebacterium matruchotii ATCC 14266]|uniref:Uncharacterized protein n=1 Tax=Corynebacterium matruchotii ATCC 14266 TaxID=553207 RepID=E0DH61_9CORY|nr:hypothetical protein HMPREF0299_5013 [Corynebacterium matruchotii ATCC 14266]